MSDLQKRLQMSWCPYCNAEAGPDCPDIALTKRAASKRVRQAAKIQIHREKEGS